MIKVYDKDMKLIAVLQNAFGIGYNKKLNGLWSAEFSLPINDPKTIYCQPLNFVEIYDGNERVDLFRIMPSNLSTIGMIYTYKCEHVLSTLFDDVLFQYHQITNYIPFQTITYLLNRQSILRWKVGTIEFTELYSYKWENENIYNALLSITKPYEDEYLWTWNTSTYPWTLNLVRPSNEISAYVRYGKNLVGIEKSIDPTNIVTRYYPLGYGEGDNQLTIKSVNGGIPYITADAETLNTYGIISDFYVDKAEENATTLKAKAQAALEKAKVPQIMYKVDAADIYKITHEPIDKFTYGSLIQVYDSENNIDFCARVVNISKPDLVDSPGEIKLDIANFDKKKISQFTAQLQSRQRISEVYSQGATNIDSNDYQDNCDATHPAVIEIYIPNECVRVNKCLLSYKTEKFRAYERSLESDPGSSQTSSAGGSAVVSAGADHWYGVVGYISAFDVTNTALTGDNAHRHAIENVNHDHTVTIPNHAHDVVIPEHTHDINYGIFEFEHLPTALIIKVDGNTIPQGLLTGNDIDIIPYLATSGGKITRGTFHKVEIFPNTTDQNPLGLARITATVVKQIFLQSRGEGDY